MIKPVDRTMKTAGMFDEERIMMLEMSARTM
jgi:hypothetical protein